MNFLDLINHPDTFFPFKCGKIIPAMGKAGEPYDEFRFLHSRSRNPVTSSPADPEIAVLAQGS